MSPTKIPMALKKHRPLNIERQKLMAQMKTECALARVDRLLQDYMSQIDYHIKFLVARTPNQVLQMKWVDFLKIGLSHFHEFQIEQSRSRYLLRSNNPCRIPRSQSQTRESRGLLHTPNRCQSQLVVQRQRQAQSLDRNGTRNMIPLTFLRWPKTGECTFSQGGSPLAVNILDERSANVQIPTKAGVLTLHPQKLMKVHREVLQQLDKCTLNQIKTLHTNLDMIVNKANKHGKF